MGQFDQNIDENGVDLTPGPDLAPAAPDEPMGIPAALLGAPAPPAIGPAQAPLSRPTPPQAPGPPGRLQQIIAQALAGLAAGLGPSHAGGGIAAGMLQGQQINAQQRQQTFHDAQLQYQQQQTEAWHQQQIAEQTARYAAAAEEKRQVDLQNAVKWIQGEVKTIPTKAEYDQRIEGYAQAMRKDPNWLRNVVPYMAPSQKERAQKAYADFIKNPVNAKTLADNPEAFTNGTIKFDANNDGVKENIPMSTFMDMMDAGLLRTKDGQPIALRPATKLPAEQQALNAKMDRFFAENHRWPQRGAEMEKLIDAARTPVKDPDMAALAKTSAELSNQIKQAQLGQIPTPDQEDMYAKLLTTNKMAPSQVQILAGGMGGQGRAFLRNVTAKALQADPNFSWEEAESTYQLVKSPSFQNTIRYMDSVVETMPRLQQNANILANGNVRFFNGIKNATRQQLNDPRVKAFRTDVLFVSDEVAKILQGGGTGSGTSDAKLRQAGEILDSSDSPAAIATALREAAAMIGTRRVSLTRGTYLDKQASDDAIIAARKKAQQGGR